MLSPLVRFLFRVTLRDRLPRSGYRGSDFVLWATIIGSARSEPAVGSVAYGREVPCITSIAGPHGGV
jgi:hypothetical protein